MRRQALYGIGSVAVLLVILASGPRATAERCSFGTVIYTSPFWHKLFDWKAPTAPTIASIAIKRGKGPVQLESGHWKLSSCDGLGWVTIGVDPPDDNRTRADRFGYLIEVVEGEAPPGFVPEKPHRALFRRETGDDEAGFFFTLLWIDEATDDQEPLDVTIVVKAKDRAGHVSKASTPLRIYHPGSGALKKTD